MKLIEDLDNFRVILQRLLGGVFRLGKVYADHEEKLNWKQYVKPEVMQLNSKHATKDTRTRSLIQIKRHTFKHFYCSMLQSNCFSQRLVSAFRGNIGIDYSGTRGAKLIPQGCVIATRLRSTGETKASGPVPQTSHWNRLKQFVRKNDSMIPADHKRVWFEKMARWASDYVIWVHLRGQWVRKGPSQSIWIHLTTLWCHVRGK